MRCFRRVLVEELDEGQAGFVIALQVLLDHLAPVLEAFVALQVLALQAHPLRHLSVQILTIPNVPAIAEDLRLDVLDGILPQGLHERIRCANMQVHIARSRPWGGNGHECQAGSVIGQLPDRIFTSMISSISWCRPSTTTAGVCAVGRRL
jgi:hypothetical protein